MAKYMTHWNTRSAVTAYHRLYMWSFNAGYHWQHALDVIFVWKRLCVRNEPLVEHVQIWSWNASASIATNLQAWGCKHSTWVNHNGPSLKGCQSQVSQGVVGLEALMHMHQAQTSWPDIRRDWGTWQTCHMQSAQIVNFVWFHAFYVCARVPPTCHSQHALIINQLVRSDKLIMIMTCR